MEMPYSPLHLHAAKEAANCHSSEGLSQSVEIFTDFRVVLVQGPLISVSPVSVHVPESVRVC